jgi:Transposase zinc-binding domain/Putative transposase
VVKKLHRKPPNTPARYALMTAAPTLAWSVFTQIFAEHWDGFKRVHPRYDRPYYDGLVHKRLACGDPEQMGYIAYRCLQGGQGTHRVAMSCQSALCLRCAKVYVDNWVSQVSQMLHEGVIYRHIVLTVPEILRKTFYQQAQAVLSPFMRCGARCLEAVYSRVSSRALKGGSSMIIQTHGRHGQYNPPWHIIATSGGGDQQAKQWVHLDDVPYRLLRQQWPWSRLTMLRQTVQTQERRRLVETCYTRSREGFVTNGQKGEVPARYQSLARYLAKEVVSPPISLRRIDRYDGQRVTYHSRSHRSEQGEWETVKVSTVIGRMVQHTFPTGFQRRRYDGVQATKTFAKLKAMIHDALAKVKGIIKGAIQIIAPLTYRQRYQQSTGRDPLHCPHCHSEMGLWRIWHPVYGVIHDELEAIRRGKYASQAPRAAPAGPGRTVWPAAGGISLSLPGLR